MADMPLRLVNLISNNSCVQSRFAANETTGLVHQKAGESEKVPTSVSQTGTS